MRFIAILVCFAAVACMAVPGWCAEPQQPTGQEAAQSQAQPAAGPAAADTMAQPAESQAKPAEQPAAAENQDQPAMEEKPAMADEAAPVIIEEAVVCQDVVDRAPVGISDTFAKETAKLYCFTRVVGAQADSQITHNWYYQGALKASVKLNVRSSNFRTWSSKTIIPEWAGEWMVEILSEDGKPLESIIFFIQ